MRALLASVVVCAACARAPDPCAKFDRDACVTLEVRADRDGVEIDQLRLRAPSLGLAEALSPSTPLSPPAPLPVYIALIMPIGWSSNTFALDVDGLLRGGVVGSRSELVQVGGGEHRRVTITLVTPTVIPDLAGADLAGVDLANPPDLAPLDGGFVLPGSRDVDAGAFAESSTGLSGGDIQWIDARDGRVLAATRAGLFRSDNNGTSWSKVGVGLPTQNLTMVAIAPSNPLIVYATPGFYASDKLARSDDAGATFKPVGTANFSNGVFVAVSHQDPDVIYVGPQRSTDGGKSYNSPTGITGQFSYQVAVSPKNDQVALWGNNDGLFGTIDGKTWIPINDGLPASTIATRVQISADGTKMFAFPAVGVYKRDLVLAPTWVLEAQPPTDRFIWAGAVKPTDESVIVYSTDVFSSTAPGFFRKDGTGTSAAGVGIAPMGARSVLFDPDATSRVWVGSSAGGAFRSDDSGANFVQVSDGIRAVQVNSVAPDGDNPKVLWTGTSNGLWRSGDGGASWSQRTNGVPARATIVKVLVDGPRVWAATSDQLLLSNDNGLSFTPVLTQPKIMDFTVEGMNVYLGTFANGFLVSRNRAASFNPPAQGPPRQTARVLIDPANPQIVWTLAVDSDAFTFWQPFKSVDRGDHFSPIPGTSICTSLALDPLLSGTVYAGCSLMNGTERLLKSDNGGSSWTRADTGLGTNPSVLAVASSNRLVLYASSSSASVSISTDGALSWQGAGISIGGKFLDGDPRVSTLAIDPRNEAVLFVGLTEFPSLIRRAPTN